jgi:hypothetical protein
MTRRITLCTMLLAVGIAMVMVQVSNGQNSSRRSPRQPKISRQVESKNGARNHHSEYERMRAQYGFINL